MRFVQSYEILLKNEAKTTENARKTAQKGSYDCIFSSFYTKTALFFTFDKNKKYQKIKKMLTIPYIYDKISSLSARRSERLLQMSDCYGV